MAKKKKFGRPALKPAQRRSVNVTVRMTEAERRQVENDAEKAGVSVSMYLLTCWKNERAK